MQRIGKLAFENPKAPYLWHNGLIYYKGRVVIPPQSTFIHQLLHEFHDSNIGGHLGVFCTYKRLAQQFYWLSIYNKVKEYVSFCQECQRVKAESLSPVGLLQPLPIPCQV